MLFSQQRMEAPAVCCLQLPPLGESLDQVQPRKSSFIPTTKGKSAEEIMADYTDYGFYGLSLPFFPPSSFPPSFHSSFLPLFLSSSFLPPFFLFLTVIPRKESQYFLLVLAFISLVRNVSYMLIYYTKISLDGVLEPFTHF